MAGEEKSGSPGYLALIVSLVVAVLLLVLLLICCWRRRKRRSGEAKVSAATEKTPALSLPPPPPYTFARLSPNQPTLTKPIGASPRPSPRARRRRMGRLTYGDQALKLDAVFLDNQNELVVAVRSGRSFPADREALCRVELREDRWPAEPRLLKTRETRPMRGMGAPRWGERVSLTGVHVEDLQELSLLVTALTKEEGGGETVVGFVELSLDSLHDSGRDQWLRVISHEGIVSQEHFLARHAD